MEIIMTEEEEKKMILSSGILQKRVELPKKETSPILCGGEPDIIGFFKKAREEDLKRLEE